MTAIRFGVIGVGLMGRLHAANIIRLFPATHLQAISDVSPTACADTVASHPVEAVHEDYREMLAVAEIDAVVISTPPELHGEMIEAAAAAGKHIFCEKPIDCELSRIDRALEAVASAGVKLQLGFNRRFDDSLRRAQEAVATGEIGRPLTLHLISRDPVRAADEKATFAPEMFLDTTIHDFDMARFVMGSEILSVSSMAIDESYGSPGETPHTAITAVRFASGAAGVIDNSWLSTYGYDQRLEVFGTQGMISVENEARPAGLADDADERSLPFFVRRYFDSYAEEMAAFVECVLEDKAPMVTGADGRAAVALALAAQRSCREGRPVAVAEVG